jgi:hypothetical protein
MRKWLPALLFAFLALFVSAAVTYAETGISRADLHAQNNSGEEGTAVLSGLPDGTTKVEITLSGAEGMDQPAHIHQGSCANLNPVPAYPLNNVVNGTSTTIVKVPITDLLGGRYAINVHKSAAEVSTYVACGDLTALMNAGGTAPGTAPGMPTTGQAQPGLPAGLLLLLLGGPVLLVLGGHLRRRALRR